MANDVNDQNPTSDKDRPLYVISVAAELVDMHPQTLRLYERKGLYSQRDIEHLREIRRLTQELGINLAGVEEIIRLRRKLDSLQARMEGNISHLQKQLQESVSSYQRQLGPPREEREKGEDEA
jgi:MerR family transcriptional regulator/heat shock protein HspR